MRILLGMMLACSPFLVAETNVISEPQAAPVQSHSTASAQPLNLDGRKWKVGHEAKEDGRLIREYVLENEDVNNWTELFSIQQFSDVPVDPQEFYKLFVEGLQQAVPQNKVESRVIKDSPNTLLGEWWVADKSPNDQHEWIKIFKEGNDLLIVRYTTKKVKDVDSIRKKWEGILDNFQAEKEK
jgi:hypothetical protein